MALQNYDKLNSLSTKWFSKMDISDSEKKKRVDLSLEYCEIIIMLFLLITEEDYEREESIKFAEERLKVIAENYVGKDDIAYINDWSHKEAEKVVDVTFKHRYDIPQYTTYETENGGTASKETTFDFEELDIEVPQTKYWTSEERGLLIGVECAAITANFEDLSRAMDSGKTRKVWLTEADNRVRPTHDEVHGTEIAITDYFVVGNSYMLFPGDMSMDAEEKEICSCRCHCTYF